MNKGDFVDYYEVLEASQNANSDTIERIFRYLAHRFHPDTSSTNDVERFNQLVEAYNVLRDPVTRAAYDVEHAKQQELRSELQSGVESAVSDSVDRHRLLSMFYAKRRQSMREPGVGIVTLEQASGCPQEILEFHLWYFREKNWIQRDESGTMSITAEGVDEIESHTQMYSSELLIGESSPVIESH